MNAKGGYTLIETIDRDYFFIFNIDAWYIIVTIWNCIAL